MYRRINRLTPNLLSRDLQTKIQRETNLKGVGSPQQFGSNRPYLVPNTKNKKKQISSKNVYFNVPKTNSKKNSVKNFSQPKKKFKKSQKPYRDLGNKQKKKRKVSNKMYQVNLKKEGFQNMTINIQNKITANHCNFFQIPPSPAGGQHFPQNNHSPRNLFPREVLSQRDIQMPQNLYQNVAGKDTGDEVAKIEGFLYKSHHPALKKESESGYEIGQMLSMRSPVLRRANPFHQLKSSKSLKYTKNHGRRGNQQGSKARNKIWDNKNKNKKKKTGAKIIRQVPKVLKSLNSIDPYKEENILGSVPLHQRKKFLNSRSQERFKTIGEYTQKNNYTSKNHMDYTRQFRLNPKVSKILKKKIQFGKDSSSLKMGQVAFLTKDFPTNVKKLKKPSHESNPAKWEIGSKSQIHYSSVQTPNPPSNLSNRKKSTTGPKRRRPKHSIQAPKSVMGKFTEILPPLSVSLKSDKLAEFHGKFSKLFDVNSTRGRLNTKPNFTFKSMAEPKRKKKKTENPKLSRDEKPVRVAKKFGVSLFGKKDAAFMDFERKKAPVTRGDRELIFSKISDVSLDFRKKKLNFEKKRKTIAQNHKKSRSFLSFLFFSHSLKLFFGNLITKLILK